MIEVSSEQSTCQFYVHAYRGLPCRCCLVCCYTTAVPAAAVLLLPPAVRRRVPDGQICGFIESDPSVSCHSNATYFDVPLGRNVSHLRSRFAYILGNCGHARSQGGRQPAAAKPPSYSTHEYVCRETRLSLVGLPCPSVFGVK